MWLNLSWNQFELDCYNFKSVICNHDNNNKENICRIYKKGNEKGTKIFLYKNET